MAASPEKVMTTTKSQTKVEKECDVARQSTISVSIDTGKDAQDEEESSCTVVAVGAGAWDR